MTTNQPTPKKQVYNRPVKCTIDPTQIPNDFPPASCPLCFDANTTRYAIQFSKLFLSCPTCQLVFLHPRHHLTPEEEKKRYEEHNNSPYDQRYRSFLAPVVEELTPLLGEDCTLLGLDYGCGPGPTLSTMFREKGFKMADYDPYFKPMPFIDELPVFQPGNTPTATNTNTATESTSNTPNTTTTNTINTPDTTNTENSTENTNTTTTNTNPTTEINATNTTTTSTFTKHIPPYDQNPFTDDHFEPPFDFITCTEAAEHFKQPALDFQKLLNPLLLQPSGGILAIMTQMLYTKEQFVNWWYLRDKTHVSFYSSATMEYIAKSYNMRLILPSIKNIAIFIRIK